MSNQLIVRQKQFLLDSSHLKGALSDLEAREKTQAFKGKRWCCAICGACITDENDAIAVDGGHQHLKINPLGHSFEIRCFKKAAGCKREGVRTEEYSWFSDYSWQFAHCVCCNSQLGWFYSGPQSFYGLIKQQIVPCTK